MITIRDFAEQAKWRQDQEEFQPAFNRRLESLLLPHGMTVQEFKERIGPYIKHRKRAQMSVQEWKKMDAAINAVANAPAGKELTRWIKQWETK